MKNTTKKGRRWIYLLFFTIGILSLPLSIFLWGLLASADLIRFDGPSELLFALLICSILFTIGLYAYNKELSFIFVLKLFIISIVTSFSIFYVSLFLGLLPPLFPLLILLILFVIGLIAFKEYPLINFALKAFAISFIALFLVFGGFLMWSAHEHTGAISIEKFDTLEEILEKTEKVECEEITEEDLKGYPALAKAIRGEGCKKLNEDSWYLEVHPEEWKRTRVFIGEKGSNVIKVGELYYEVGFVTA